MRPDNYYLELEKQGYYETIDKRSKDYREYKEWKTSKRSEDYNKSKQNVETQSKGVGLHRIVHFIDDAKIPVGVRPNVKIWI